MIFKEEVKQLKSKTAKEEESKEEGVGESLAVRERELMKEKGEEQERRLKAYYESEDFREYWWGRAVAVASEIPAPSEFEFVVKNGKEQFEAGSQMYLSYGGLSNRDLLLRYGFALRRNKYNNVNL